MDPETLKAQGWKPLDADGFSGQIAPLWVKGGNTEPMIGFIAEPRHSNTHMGTLHGGALMTFADLGLGYGASRVLGGTNCSTAQMHIYLVAAPQIGEFIFCKPEVVRSTKRLIFVRGLIQAGDRTVASADGIWKIFEERPQ